MVLGPLNAPRGHGRQGRQRGLTLLELMTVLAVLAVLGALALPTVSARMQRQRAALAAETLLGDLHEARFEAVRMRRTVAVRAQPGPDWCWRIDVPLAGTAPRGTGAPKSTGTATGTGTSTGTRANTSTASCGCELGEPACGVHQVHAAAHPGVRMSAGTPAALRPDGTAMPVTVAVFETPRGERLQVHLGTTGRAHVCAEDRALLRYPRC